MKGFVRKNLLFSLRGLNCALCPMQLGNYCPGCGGGEGNQSCAIARCSLENGKVEFCFDCTQFPCSRYRQTAEFDSFVTHQNQLSDLQKARQLGIVPYTQELLQKRQILLYLLQNYNDGRKKTLFCTAVNLLPLTWLQSIIAALDNSESFNQKERSALAASLLQQAADELGLSLRLRKKQK